MVDLRPRFNVGEYVCAVEPLTPRAYAAKILRVIEAPATDGGPWYEVEFCEDGQENTTEGKFFLSGQYIYGRGRLGKISRGRGPFVDVHVDGGEAASEKSGEFQIAANGVLAHRKHRHGRLPCPFVKEREARGQCKIDYDYCVAWVGYDYHTWESEEQFEVIIGLTCQ
jgi:hypothetical protein